MARKAYHTDLTDEEWERIRGLIPEKVGSRGRPRQVDLREVFNALKYLVRAGCAWRLLPHEFPFWGTVYYYFRTFRRRGVWEKIHDALREEVRKKTGGRRHRAQPFWIASR